MENIFENKYVKKLQRAGESLARNKEIRALNSGMMALLGVLMVSAIFQILATVPTLPVLNLCDTGSAYYQFMITPYKMLKGLMSMIMAFTIGYSYAENLGLKPMSNGINSMLMTLMVSAPGTDMELAGGTVSYLINPADLGPSGMFTAIFVTFITVRIAYICQKKNVMIKLPDVVPPSLGESFTALLPLLFSTVLWLTLSTILNVSVGMTVPQLIGKAVAKPIELINSVPGMLLAVFFANLLWVFGIHSGTISYVLYPIYIQNLMANSEAVSMGLAPMFYATFIYFNSLSCGGGSGNTLSLVLMGMKSKSEQIKAISKASVVPSIFGINEPVTFGFPIMYNPILAIPFVLNPIFVGLVVWAGFSIGFFQPPITTALVMCMGLGEFLLSLSWRNVLIPVVAVIISGLCYYPFFKIYEKQLVEKETAAKMAAQEK